MRKEQPYLLTEEVIVKKTYSYNPNYGDDRICVCGHPYYRHFDTYENMLACGCKYCQCFEFIEELNNTSTFETDDVMIIKVIRENEPQELWIAYFDETNTVAIEKIRHKFDFFSVVTDRNVRINFKEYEDTIDKFKWYVYDRFSKSVNDSNQHRWSDWMVVTDYTEVRDGKVVTRISDIDDEGWEY